MSDIIKLLPDFVANQIAAGEVVQRPASVVKELLENAIDAGGTKIELIIRDAGKNLIQVVDNGIGMSETDARMAFERHATSKIAHTDDIFKIATKGFRGEALASIAAVAQVELKTKQKDAVIGTNLYIEGGELQFQEEVQTPEGSSFSVKNLFYNVPARRKFLKSDNVEFRHILDEFHRVALAHEQVEFSLFHNDTEVFKLRKGTLLQRIVEIFGRRMQTLLVPIKEDTDLVNLGGFVAKPEGAKRSRGEQFFFVNGRFFRSAYLNKAVQEAFEGLLQPGYLPSFFLYLEVAPERIDVNIHPQKTEIKFEDEALIFALIRSTVKRALGIYNIAPSLDFEKDESTNPMYHFQQEQPTETPPSDGLSRSAGIYVDRDYNPFKQENHTPTERQALADIYQNNIISAEPSKINLFDDEDFDEELMRLPNGYWLYNKGEKTLMLDPGRMHTVLVTRRNATIEMQNTGQKLLYSIEYHLNEMEKNKYRSIKKYLPELGFEMELGDDGVLRINTIPQGLGETQVTQFMEKIFEVLEYQSQELFRSYYDAQWAKLNAKSRFSFLYKTEVEKLVKDFTECGFPEYTPTGKRCYIELPLEELRNKMKK